MREIIPIHVFGRNTTPFAEKRFDGLVHRQEKRVPLVARFNDLDRDIAIGQDLPVACCTVRHLGFGDDRNDDLHALFRSMTTETNGRNGGSLGMSRSASRRSNSTPGTS